MPAWLRYTLLRLLVFAVPLAILLFLGVDWFWAALVSTVVALCVSFIFLRRPRDEIAAEWAARRPKPTRDDEAEDAAIDAAAQDDTEEDAADGPVSGPASGPASGDDGLEPERRAES